MIISTDSLHWLSKELRAESKQVVLANGCFDLLHVAHVEHLKAARQLGDVLIVLVTPNVHVGKRLGTPVIDEGHRVQMVSSLRCVDYAVLGRPMSSVERYRKEVLRYIQLIQPQYYAKGSEFKGKESPTLLQEIDMVERCGGHLVYTDSSTVHVHTTDIINSIVDRFGSQVLTEYQDVNARSHPQNLQRATLSANAGEL